MSRRQAIYASTAGCLDCQPRAKGFRTRNNPTHQIFILSSQTDPSLNVYSWMELDLSCMVIGPACVRMSFPHLMAKTETMVWLLDFDFPLCLFRRKGGLRFGKEVVSVLGLSLGPKRLFRSSIITSSETTWEMIENLWLSSFEDTMSP